MPAPNEIPTGKTEEPTHLLCGCCYGGCICVNHANADAGVYEAKCDWHQKQEDESARLSMMFSLATLSEQMQEVLLLPKAEGRA